MKNGRPDAATVAATTRDATPRIEIVADRRRAHTAEFRAEVVTEAGARGARVREVARRHGLSPSLIYRWRRTIRAGAEAGDTDLRLYPVRITDTPAATPMSRQPSAPIAAVARAGLIEIELAGDVRVRIDETISTAALRRVMAVLRR